MENPGLYFEDALASALGSWPEGTVFLAAVSGGADSTAMLSALAALVAQAALRPGLNFRLHALHVEHGIRPAEESRGDAAAVEALSGSLGVPCRIVSIKPGKVLETARRRGIGLEGAARLYRHAAWKREARRLGAARVLVAHTRDDLLETVLMRFLKGSGPRGLAAMPLSHGLVLRPLLHLTRREVLEYLEYRRIPFRTDSTNADPAFFRNRVRNELIPLLDTRFPGWRTAVYSLAETQALAADFLEEESRKRLPWRRSPGNGKLAVPEELFFSQSPIIREEAVFAAASLLGKDRRASSFSPDQAGRKVSAPRRQSLRAFLRSGRKAADLGPFALERENSLFVVSPRRASLSEEGFSLLIKEPGRYKLKKAVFCVEPFSPSAGKNREGLIVRLPLLARPVREDDFIVQGGRKVSLPSREEDSRYTWMAAFEDPLGIAAFAGIRGKKAVILLSRESPAVEDMAGEHGENFSFFYIDSGGTDV